MATDAEGFELPGFDTEDPDDESHHETLQEQTPREDIQFAKPPSQPELPEPPELPHPDIATITELLTEALRPLESAIETLVEAQDEEIQETAQANKLLLKTISDMNKSLQQIITTPQSGTSPDAHNISAFQFQAAMLQPCNGQILPEYVRAEIDRLYTIEKAYKIARRAERALDHILDHDQILIKLPDNPDEQLLLTSVLNGWYTQAHPDREPLKLLRPASSSDHQSARV
jgi:hypothetical protein